MRIPASLYIVISAILAAYPVAAAPEKKSEIDSRFSNRAGNRPPDQHLTEVRSKNHSR
jgi:hypothetical protein